jgi:hypothetical protein
MKHVDTSRAEFIYGTLVREIYTIGLDIDKLYTDLLGKAYIEKE